MIKPFVRNFRNYIVKHETPWHDRLYRLTSNLRNNRFRWSKIEGPANATVESGGVVIGRKLLAVAGYGTGLGEVCDVVQVFDLIEERWEESIPMPDGLSHSHHGIATDGDRYVYFVGGQVGPNCSPCNGRTFVLDTRSWSWKALLPLPQPRYSPVVEIVQGRLHIIAGNDVDRYTSIDAHVSIGLGEGCFAESEWRNEPPIPRGGHHRASVVIDGDILVFGGQERDVRSILNDPSFVCDWETPDEILYSEVYRYRTATREWVSMAPIPRPVTHAEFSIIRCGREVLILGGMVSRYELIDSIYAYDVDGDAWREVGVLPYPIKGHLAFTYQSNVYVFSGQKSRMPGDFRPGKVLNSGWKSRLPDFCTKPKEAS